MIKDLKKILPHIRFWLWGAMHYERFDQFQILLLPPVWIAPNYFHKATKEMIVIVGSKNSSNCNNRTHLCRHLQKQSVG